MGIRAGSFTSGVNPYTVFAEVYCIGSLFHYLIEWGKNEYPLK